MLDNIIVILVETSHPGNIGGVARAMKNMGLKQLRLVNPNQEPWTDALARAADAIDVLQQANIYPTLAEAINDCAVVMGTSARNRHLAWPQLEIHKDAEKILAFAKPQKVALLFGRESSGLTNTELQLCNYQLTIPANPEYSSLNLAAAVQVVAYEVYTAYLSFAADAAVKSDEALATKQEVENFYQHLEQTAIDVQYLDPYRPGSLMPRFRRIFNRANLTKIELNVLRGLLSAIQKRFNNDK